ncbi:MAG: hypothetical protein AAF961_08165, partial [Planctomycetota bacterium]
MTSLFNHACTLAGRRRRPCITSALPHGVAALLLAVVGCSSGESISQNEAASQPADDSQSTATSEGDSEPSGPVVVGNLLEPFEAP